MENQEKGKWGEDAAVRYLRGKGFEIRDLNWKFLHLEIDIVAMHEDKLVIIEVKTRERMLSANRKFLSIKQSRQD